ncbi:3-deoxy-D-manno-octulosonic-acid transferase [Hoeflea phototrophica DFL-43]|uniref:3-deoxy-D-manno-octulosonic acid transferase n=1 Tax=Hoeflea phototrophica (strain DSM 17068 / NCIMB 14078 / DFL-43) TaxID=411684 RepID=A9D0H0_HOEPD|nr:lipid IV(A) 3-deoxy-D-manno-octulosonic acid transferase [Hoeflea phototrophica]EDQ34996.1 3-deoxy-D-manno-octulosonic-acid transferase [Hoeflea phototrophica DFL-43]
MSRGWARAALVGYRWFGAGIYPLLGPYLAIRAAKGKEERSRRKERYGRSNIARPIGPLVWFHAASVGETNAVIPLIREVRRRGITVVLTTGTVTSAGVARDRVGDDVIHQYVPLDLKPAVSRFLDYWKPDLAIIAESEIWPMTILELGARRTPQVLVNGRLSDRSFARWSRRPSLADALFENLSHVVAQSDLDAERFRSLGARPVTVSGNLKVDTVPPPWDKAELARLQAQIDKRATWAAVSTFEGEDEIAAAVHRALKPRHKALTILVPRHPDRGDAIETMLKNNGLNVARRSRGDTIGPDTDVYLGDTIGEMGLYLNLTEIVFVGKSLMGGGGQNPLEPAMLGCAVLSGSKVENFREAYARLLRNGGARFVRDGEMLAKGVHYLLSNPQAREAMAVGGEKTLNDMRGALKATVRALEPYINPLTVKARLLPRDNEDAETQAGGQW